LCDNLTLVDPRDVGLIDALLEFLPLQLLSCITGDFLYTKYVSILGLSFLFLLPAFTVILPRPSVPIMWNQESILPHFLLVYCKHPLRSLRVLLPLSLLSDLLIFLHLNGFEASYLLSIFWFFLFSGSWMKKKKKGREKELVFIFAMQAQANQNAPSGLSDSTISLLSSSSSSITLPLALSTSTGTTTDDEPASPPCFRNDVESLSSATVADTEHSDYPCSEISQAYDHHSFVSDAKDKCVILRTAQPLFQKEKVDFHAAAVEDESTFIVDNDDAFEFDPHPLRSPSDSCKSQNNSSTSSDGSGSARSRLRIRPPPPKSTSSFHQSTNCNSPLFHYCPPCGSAVTGTMFHLRFVGSLEVEEEVGSGKYRRKRAKKAMVEEAVVELKVDLIISFLHPSALSPW